MSNQKIDLVILRHGEANHATPDRNRSLTNRGQEQILSQCQWLKQQQFQPDLILHSPYERTTQSATIANGCFNSPEVNVEDFLTPEADPSLMLALLPTFLLTQTNRQILLVSHMPMVSYLTSELLANKELFGYPVAGLCWLALNKDDLFNSHILHKQWASSDDR